MLLLTGSGKVNKSGLQHLSLSAESPSACLTVFATSLNSSILDHELNEVMSMSDFLSSSATLHMDLRLCLFSLPSNGSMIELLRPKI